MFKDLHLWNHIDYTGMADMITIDGGKLRCMLVVRHVDSPIHFVP